MRRFHIKRSHHNGHLAAIGIRGAAAKDLHSYAMKMSDIEYKKFVGDLSVLKKYRFKADREFVMLWERMGSGARNKNGKSLASLMYYHLFQVAQYYHETNRMHNPWSI